MPTRRRLRKRLHAVALLFGLAVSVTLVAAFELLARRLNPLWTLRDRFFLCREVRPDLGGGFRSDCSSRWIRATATHTVFDIGFSTDSFGRRLTPQSKPELRNKVALFFGCSFTVGAGVEASETLPAHFAKLASGYRVLNYGASGFGPSQALMILRRPGLTGEEVGAFDGKAIAIYTLIGDHVGRTAGSWKVIGTFGAYFPAFGLEPDGRLALDGNFIGVYPWRTWIAGLCAKSALLRRLPEVYTADDVELTARVLLEASRMFRGRFMSDRFVILAYPGSWSHGGEVLPRLRALGLTVLDPRDRFERDEGELRLLDGHPIGASYARVAGWLFDELRRKGWILD